MKAWLRRFGVYGDIWLRYLSLGAKITPWFLEPVVVAVFSVFFYLVSGNPRRALLDNMAVLFPKARLLERHQRAFRVVWNFAATLADAAHTRNGHDVINWEIDGLEHLDALAGSPSGVMILTAHMGNYDLAAPLFAERLRRPIHIVRAPERDVRSQDFSSGQRDQAAAGWFVVHYNRPGGMLAVELTRCLKDHQVVAIQGDRILFDIAPTLLPFDETHDWHLPKGPFLLAQVASCPVFPLFITRTAWRCYRITALSPYESRENGMDRALQREELAIWWSTLLATQVRRSWNQWFVFESAFIPRNTGGNP
jgi:phosphatidylinositol dimannoside acyltransferase